MTTTRRKFLKTISYGTVALSMPLFNISCRKQTKRPNILFIMSDDHAEQAISCYSDKLIQTPNIDRIANEGMLFKNSFVTNSICAPSRAVLLTGKYSHLNGLRDNRDQFDGGQVTFPKLLQKVGYHTSVIGKWHLKTEPTGFDNWKILIGQGQYYNPVFNEMGEKKQRTGYTTDLITDFAIEELENRDAEKPFCMLVHHKAPHRNWMPHSKYFDAFEDEDLPLPETFYDNYKGRKAAEAADMRVSEMFLSLDFKLDKGSYKKETGTGGSKKYADRVAQGWENDLNRLTPEQRKSWDDHYDKVNAEFKKKKLKGDALLKWKYQRYIKDYLRCILSVDENVGRLLDYLDEKGLAENTIVVYTSDQGFYLGEHGWYDKRFMYEESLSMPLVIRYPKEMKAGGINEDMVLNLDFASTFLDFAGVEIPAEMQGESLRPLLKGKAVDTWRKSMYYHYYEYPHGWHEVRKHYGIRTERYKLIRFYGEMDEWELYDLENDPNEMNNLYGKKEYQEIVDTLKTELQQLQAKYKDTIVS